MSRDRHAKPLRKKEKRDPAATREALLQAGAELFAEAGYEGVRVDALAERAGVNKAMINYHFGGKRQLYVAVIRSAFSALLERVEELRGSSDPPSELIRQFIGSFGALVQKRRPGFPALVIREALSPSDVSREVIPLMIRVLLGVREILERGMREGSLRKVDPTLVYLNLIGGLAFFFATEPLRRRVREQLPASIEPPSADAYVEYVQQLVARGLAPESPAAADQGAKP